MKAPIQCQVGDKIQEIPIEFDGKVIQGRIGILEKITIVPNGSDDRYLVAILRVKFETSIGIAASTQFQPVEDYNYQPSFT